jgi:hypothetical protein
LEPIVEDVEIEVREDIDADPIEWNLSVPAFKEDRVEAVKLEIKDIPDITWV